MLIFGSPPASLRGILGYRKEAMMDVRIKRVYLPAERADGHRVLVDRLWPRGLAKSAAGVQDWFRDLAPSTELRRWFRHDPARWAEFKRRYFAELDAAPDRVETLVQLARKKRVTLLYGAKDETHNNAVALREYLQR